MRNPLSARWLLTLSRIERLPRKSAVTLITLYQHTLSPDHGPLRHLYRYGYCRHEPTCSEYGKRVIMEHGLIVGSFLTAKRLLTCHPWRKPSPERMMRASHGIRH
ncbi:MAG: membrane protein insertion efficiency factor YidD [Candidatus Peribacteraceae bacterium]|nr:membrane protein insertion efficiency factor YidD [Candidatus Peribacteraceae bacterium]MDD5742583.1 membrane protein insertion efficiency factor YidD [Candidatus Peribacteraceae bacterium]